MTAPRTLAPFIGCLTFVVLGLAGCSREADSPAWSEQAGDATGTADVVDFEPVGEGPEIVLIERDPWLAVIGSDSPSFALYGDGSVIFRREDGFRSVELSEQEHRALRQSIGSLTPASRNANFELTQWSDQPSNTLMLVGGKDSVTTVYGSLDDPEQLQGLPPDLRSALQAARAFRHPDAQPWMPELIEVMIWPHERAPGISIVWPDEWPGLDDPDTKKRGEGSYSLFLPARDREALERFLESRNARGAVEIDGRKFSASVRYPFPGEDMWMGG